MKRILCLAAVLILAFNFSGCTTSYKFSSEFDESHRISENEIDVRVVFPRGETENREVWTEYFRDTPNDVSSSFRAEVSVDRVFLDISPRMILFLGLVPASGVIEHEVFLIDESSDAEYSVSKRSYRIIESWGSNNTIKAIFGRRHSYEDALVQLVTQAAIDLTKDIKNHNKSVFTTP